MTTDTVTADDLAAALREAVRRARVEFTVFLTVPDQVSEVDRWQLLIDRFDAQCREEIEELEKDRDTSMSLARSMNRGDWPSWHVREARAANHRILHLRRQLRAMGGDV